MCVVFRPDGDTQIGRCARLVEVPHQYRVFAQRRREFRPAPRLMPGKDEICTRRQNDEAEPHQLPRHRFASRDDPRTAFAEVSLVANRSGRARLGKAAERLGIEAVLHATQRLDQPRVAERIAEAQAGQGARL